MTRPDLVMRLKERDYREAFVSSTINSTIAYQIRDLRKEHDLGQADLGNLAGMKQTAISRLENPDYGNLSVNTLKRIAKALDVALIVRLVPYSELARWRLTMTRKDMIPASFDKDEGLRDYTEGVFHGRTPTRIVAATSASQDRSVKTASIGATKQLLMQFDASTPQTLFWKDSTPEPRKRAA